jgi:hypothetical protein
VHAIGYQFGLAYFEAPFYAVGKLFAAVGWTTIGGQSAQQASVAGGAVVYVGATIGLLYALLRRLRLRFAALSASLVVYGTSVFYYGVFSPGQTHSVDVFLASAIALLCLLGFELGWPLKLMLAVGVVGGAATAVRWFDAMLLVGISLTLFAIKRRWEAAITAASGVVTLVLLAIVPTALGVHVFSGGYDANLLSFAPFSPLRMLFTVHRGLFVWTPLTLIGAVGYVCVMRWRRDVTAFLAALATAGVLVVCSYASFATWDGGLSFSQRYFTVLVPLWAIGVAGLLEIAPRIVTPLCAFAVAWALFLALTMQMLTTDQRLGADGIARLGAAQTPGAYALGLWQESRIARALPWRPFGRD